VIDIFKAWLGAVPWESVQTLNQALCQAQKAEYATNAKTFASVAARWQSAVPRTSGLVEILDLIRECREALPFTLNNGNTFAAIAKTLVDDWLQSLSPLEAQIVRTTVCHYVAGQVGRKELLQVLEHLGPACKQPAPAPVASKSAPVGQVQAQGAA
jgi:hypothetical protein